MTIDQEEANLREFAKAAVQAEQQSAATLGVGYPAVAMCTQWAIESQYGDKVSGNYNFWGITAAAAPSYPSKMCPTYEDLTPELFAELPESERETVTSEQPLGGGRYRYRLSRAFASFPDAATGILTYIDLITAHGHRYYPAWQAYVNSQDVDVLLVGIAKAGYATAPGYADELLAVANGSRIQQAVQEAKGNADNS